MSGCKSIPNCIPLSNRIKVPANPQSTSTREMAVANALGFTKNPSNYDSLLPTTELGPVLVNKFVEYKHLASKIIR